MSTDTDTIPDTETAINLFRQNRSREIAQSTIDRYEIGVREWIEYLSEPGAKPYDPNEYDRDVKKFWEADEFDVRRHLRALLDESDCASGTVQIRRSALVAFYEALAEISNDEAIPFTVPNTDNPAAEINLSDWVDFKDKRTKKQRESSSNRDINYLKPDEVRQLVESVPNPVLRNELIVKLLFHTGMRRKELANIKLEDIDDDNRQISVEDTKNNQERTVYYPPELETLLDRWRDVHRAALATAESDYLFPTSHSEQINPEYINQVVKQAADNADLQATAYTDGNGRERQDITAHTLRHSFAVSCLENGMNIREIQELLGHSKVETTEIYTELADDSIEDSYRTHGTQKL